MKFAIFCHSILSDWNHGNAHFLRGIGTELVDRGHPTIFFEPSDAWSYQNLLTDGGDTALRKMPDFYPLLQSNRYTDLNLDHALEGIDYILVHEWNSPTIIRRLGQFRSTHPQTRLLFHDTHHRAITDPNFWNEVDLTHYDGVLAFGETLAARYRQTGKRVWVWHEAADTRIFRPLRTVIPKRDLVWIGNWGDDERVRELDAFIFQPVVNLGLNAKIHGVRYPDEALKKMGAAGIEYGGWLPNFGVPEVFSHSRLTVHVPRGPYRRLLRGIPTIRPFEALACGIPLICAPWDDCEGLFRPGIDYAVANDSAQMTRQMKNILEDPKSAEAMAQTGLQRIQERHTCRHRVEELFEILQSIPA